MSHDSRYPPPPGTYPPPPPPPPPIRVDRDRDRSGPSSSDAYSRGDSYRPQSQSYAPRDQGGRYPPPPHSSQHRPPQGDFTFRVDKPAGVGDAPYDSYRPGHATGRDRRRNRDGHGDRGNWRQDRGGRPRGGMRPPFRFVPADRPILHASHTKDPLESFVDPASGVVYKAIDDLSDSDEAEMDISDASGDEGSSREPAAKRARLKADSAASAESAPKWSNPDPYTALPPVDETAAHKKKDVVQLIRKARMQPAGESKPAAVLEETEDYIRCDFGDSDDAAEADGGVGPVPALKEAAASRQSAATGTRVPEAPTAPRLDRTSHQQPLAGSGPVGNAAAIDKPESSLRGPPKEPSRKRKADDPLTGSPDLGSRKRTFDDEIKAAYPPKLKKASKMPVHGLVVPEWRKRAGEDPCPWLGQARPSQIPISVRFHMEVLDFYDLVKPRRFEERIRKDLVDKLDRLVHKRYSDVKILPFGSFMSGLYLPTGDMDLVFCSDRYRGGGAPQYSSKNALWRLSDYLRRSRVVAEGQVEVISRAKVPLVKYIDDQTGLKVDISFENLTGVTAVNTFQAWKEQYPAMPILVTVIKHLLLMRGLNEPVNGGIGGFSVICLVVSMLQLMPQVQSRNLLPEHHLGMMLMEFLDLYGNRFNYKTTAISMNPPGYIPKNQVTTFAYKNPDRLSIIDPNNPENDIAGGSSNTERILRYFGEAHDALQQRLALLAQDSRSGDSDSILEVILGGNYSSFRKQRAHLQRLHERLFGPCQE